MTNLSIINDVWKLLKSNIDTSDVDAAAESLVNYLIEEDYSPSEIKQTFRGDKEIKSALDYFLEKPEDALFIEHVEDEEEELNSEDDYE